MRRLAGSKGQVSAATFLTNSVNVLIVLESNRPMPTEKFRFRRSAWPNVRAVEAQSAIVFTRHTHDEFGVGAIVSGAQRWVSGRGCVEAGAGCIIASNPGEVHDGAPIGDARSWRMLFIAPDTVNETVSDIRDGRAGEFEFYDPVMSGRKHGPRFRAAYRSLVERDPDEDAHERLMVLLAGMLRLRPAGRSDPPGVKRAMARIDADPAAPHPLAELAREAGVSRFQVIRSFARLTGFTPHAYVLQRRFDAALRMISTGTSLAEAAMASGFADQSHLTRVFVRRLGVAPGAFAAAMR